MYLSKPLREALARMVAIDPSTEGIPAGHLQTLKERGLIEETLFGYRVTELGKSTYVELLAANN